MNPTHKYTREILYHYTCGQCGHWWSYAHTAHKYDPRYPKMLQELTCPHCGHTAPCEEKDAGYPYHEATSYHRPSKRSSWRDTSKGWQPTKLVDIPELRKDFLETDQ